MESKEYLEAKKEFWNCIAMTIFGLGVPALQRFPGVVAHYAG